MSKHSKKNAARRRQDKALRCRTEKKQKQAELKQEKGRSGSKAAKRAAKLTELRQRQRNAAQRRIESRVKACSSMKELKELAKEVGVQGYSSWTAKQRSEAEASIVSAAMDLGVA